MKLNISRPKASITIRVFPEEKQALVELARAEDQSIDRLARMMIRDGIQARRAQKATKAVEEMEFA